MHMTTLNCTCTFHIDKPLDKCCHGQTQQLLLSCCSAEQLHIVLLRCVIWRHPRIPASTRVQQLSLHGLTPSCAICANHVAVAVHYSALGTRNGAAGRQLIQ